MAATARCLKMAKAANFTDIEIKSGVVVAESDPQQLFQVLLIVQHRCCSITCSSQVFCLLATAKSTATSANASLLMLLMQTLLLLILQMFILVQN